MVNEIVHMTPELQTLLDDHYGPTTQRTSNLIRKYGELYGLKTIVRSFSMDPSTFQHCTKTVNFVVIALHNEKREILLVHSPTLLFPGEPVGWKLLGGPIQDHLRESIEEAVNRITRSKAGTDVAELEPVAVLENQFEWGSSHIAHL